MGRTDNLPYWDYEDLDEYYEYERAMFEFEAEMLELERLFETWLAMQEESYVAA